MQENNNFKIYDFYDWQIDAYNQIRDHNAVLTAPTGSGKTLVAYLWAGIIDADSGRVKEPNARRIIFTAPIKALSNERYMDLRRMGLDVGLETGDFKRNEGASIICCTQEIYTMKYARIPDQKLIVDEFHYIFSDSDRSRMYIDGIKNTDAYTPILVMSATLGNVKSVGRYLAKTCKRKFVIHESKDRVTKLIFSPDKPLKPEQIHDALAFVFSQKGAMNLAELIADTRKRLPRKSVTRLVELAEILDVGKIPSCLYKGVGIYHGGMFPKEKLLVESAFRERLLDVVAGTNALALGVNLPAQYAVFAQLIQYYTCQPISKSEFLQMSGRAGRKGLFDPGYVTWLKDSPFEYKFMNTGKIFKQLMRKAPEKSQIFLRPAYGKLLRQQVSLKDEADYIAKYSLPELEPQSVLKELKSGMRKIKFVVSKIAYGSERKTFLGILADIWYDEMEIEENIEMARLFMEEASPSAMMAAKLILQYERNSLQSLLRIKRFANQLPENIGFRQMDELNKTIDSIDPTIYGFEEKIGEIETSR